jgi:hypothetical protein
MCKQLTKSELLKPSFFLLSPEMIITPPNNVRAVILTNIVEIADNQFDDFTNILFAHCPMLEKIGDESFQFCKTLRSVYSE